MAIACNRMTVQYVVNNRMKWEQLSILNAAALPATGCDQHEGSIEGCEFDKATKDANGNRWFYYYPEAHWDDYINDRHALDESLALILPESEALVQSAFTIAAVVEDRDFFLPGETQFAIVYPYSMKEYVGSARFREYLSEVRFSFVAPDHWQAHDEIYRLLLENGLQFSGLYNIAANYEENRMLIMVINVFSFGFILLISLIAMANVFNTVSTSIALRRREFAMLKSVGLTSRSFDRMMNYECILYGLRSLLWGVPAAFLMSYAIYLISGISYDTDFYVPWRSVAIAVGSVFIVVFATMLYATRKIRRDNPIDALRNENL